MNTLKIGLIAGMLTVSSLAFSSHINFNNNTAQTQGCTMTFGLYGFPTPITLITKNVKWYNDDNGIYKQRRYYCHFKVPKKYRHLMQEEEGHNNTRCESLDAEHDEQTDFQSIIIYNKEKIIMECRVSFQENYPD
jgi:hypothetical protein